MHCAATAQGKVIGWMAGVLSKEQHLLETARHELELVMLGVSAGQQSQVSEPAGLLPPAAAAGVPAGQQQGGLVPAVLPALTMVFEVPPDLPDWMLAR